ncbi:PAS domain-containing sensor histidine kinase [Rheinheimera sp.]|uniref:PAS domain-containing sensor histidine kinase n=1 Tax=Rheinheimera sp. TaxID=1869214 RepID=UPI003AF4840D
MQQSDVLTHLGLTALANHLPSGLAILDTEFKYLFINPTLADFNGCPVSDHLHQHVADVLPQMAGTILPMLRKVRDSGIALVNFELTPGASTSANHWFGSYLPVKDEQQQVVAIAVIASNQTREMEIQQHRQQNLKRLKQVLDNMFAFVGILQPDGTLLDANAPPLVQAGLSLEDVQGKKFWDCFWWSHSNADTELIEAACRRAAQGHTSRFDVQVQMKDGVIIIDFMMAPVFDEFGVVQFLVPSGIDITRRKRSEQALQESESRFRKVFDSAADALIAVNAEGEITLANKRAVQMFGYAPEELLGKPVDLLVPSQASPNHHKHRSGFMQHPTSRPMAQRQELFAQRKDGSLVPVEIGLTYLEQDPKAAVLATVTDVTLAVQSKQHLQNIIDEKTSLLHERELLLKEIHHRVKNNLQIVSSLLNLRSNNASPELKDLLLDSQLRIRTMALTHQLLYEQKNFSLIPLGAYLCQLCQLIRQSIAGMDSVSFDTGAIDNSLQLPLSQAIPCGLLATEILTNSIKHAFTVDQPGQIYIRLQQEQEHYLLEIGDNGRIKQDFEPGKGRSLGMQLIPAFLAQLGARFELVKSEGTHYRIQFVPDPGSNSE